MDLERLYKTSTKGATQIIDMTIEGDTYTRSWGIENGKMQSKATTAKSMNIGRSNETSPAEQAIKEAKAVWAKKQKSGYSTSPEAPVTVLLPMKVNEYKKHLKKIAPQVYTSPKLNGCNAEYRLVDGVLKLLSRGGEEYPIPPHQHDEAIALLTHLGTTSINGEQYIHGEFLQDIMAAVKKPNELSPQLKFYVFDFPEVEGDYTTRCTSMYAKNEEPIIDTPNFPFVPVWVANSPEEIEDQYTQCMKAGYEGLIIRNPKGLYKYNTRSLDVFKYKTALDQEFLVTGYKLDKNKHVVYDVVTALGDTFAVKRRGTSEERLQDAQEAPNNIGRHLTVEYEMMSKGSDKKGPVPQKPVGLNFRLVDENGEAIE